VVLVVVAFVVAAGVGAWSRMPDYEWHLQPLWLGAATLGFAVLQLTHAALWRRLLQALGQRVGGRRCRAIWCTSGLARYSPGSVLMPMVRVALAEREGVPKRVCLASVVYEVALLLTGASALGAYALVSVPALEDDPGRFAILIVPVLALAALHPRVFRPIADRALERLGREPLPSALPFRTVVGFAVLYAATWIVGGLSVYAVIRGVYPATPDDLLVVIGASAVGFVAALIGVALPGGLGAREGGLAVVVSAAVPLAVGVAVAVAVRILQLAVEIVLAAVTPLVARGR
jgi:glycosyltransferase 2 family protein